MPVYNSGVHLKPAIDSILKNTKYPFKLILVESESTDGTDKLCDQYSVLDNVEVYHTKKEGITKAINYGIKKAGNLDVYLTQDDVIIPKLYKRDWLSILVKLSKIKDCGAVTTIVAGGVSGPSYIDGFLWAGTWSLFIPRKTIKRIGLFDENFSPGPGDDIDYSYRIKKDKKIYIANFWVDHHRKTENFNDNLEFIKGKNAGYFRRKYNIYPSWSHYVFDNEDFLLDDRTRETLGCFKPNEQLDDPGTMLEIKNITKKFKKDDLTLDIGANTGLMSLVVQKGRVLAIEPTIETFDILKTNSIINSNKNIKVLNEAVYDKEVPYVMKYALLNKVPWSGMNKVEILKDGKKKTITIDSLKLKRVKLIKVDTEGCDIEVLKGASKTLDKYSPILITEGILKDNKYLKNKKYKFIKYIGEGNINSLWKKEFRRID